MKNFYVRTSPYNRGFYLGLTTIRVDIMRKKIILFMVTNILPKKYIVVSFEDDILKKYIHAHAISTTKLVY